MKVCIIAGDNADYIFSLVQALSRLGLYIDLLGGNDYEHSAYPSHVTFYNVRGSTDTNVPSWVKISRLTQYYVRCINHLRKSSANIIHIQVFRFLLLELLIFVYLPKWFGKSVIYTAHNVQQKGGTNAFKYILYRILYQNVHHIICHTTDLKNKLIQRYHLAPEKISVVQRGLNSLSRQTSISQYEARERLGVDPSAHVLLLFGRIRPYKGYEIALEALDYLPSHLSPVQVLIAGQALRKVNSSYLQTLKRLVEKRELQDRVTFHNYHIPEDDIELFFKSADVTIFPYLEGDFQSGVLFLTYRFGVPVIASNVGSFPVAVQPGLHGYLFETGNAKDLAAKISQFYRELHPQPHLCQSIRDYAEKHFSWNQTSTATLEVYERVLKPSSTESRK
jgi:glycosyltransferase involved in cell wall biosynthesis